MQKSMPGDIIACYGADAVSRLISFGTFSPFAPRGLRVGPSHVGIVSGEPGGEMLFVESTTKSAKPCQIAGKPVAGVQAHSVNERLAEYEAAGGHCRLFRLTSIDRFTFVEECLLWSLLRIHFLRTDSEELGGVGYDYGGALISGTRVLKFSRLLSANLDAVFCSELIAALLMRLNRMCRANPTRYSPVSLLRQLVRAGTYRDAGVIESHPRIYPIGEAA